MKKIKTVVMYAGPLTAVAGAMIAAIQWLEIDPVLHYEFSPVVESIQKLQRERASDRWFALDETRRIRALSPLEQREWCDLGIWLSYIKDCR